MPFLCCFSHKGTCASLTLIPFSLVLKSAVFKIRTADIKWIFRTLKETSKLHQNLPVFVNDYKSTEYDVNPKVWTKN